jgi:DNA invertase Pin-like site-specific DNA recombinase
MTQMKVKYNRVSTTSQSGERFDLDRTKYDLTLLDVVSGGVRMEERREGKKLLQLVKAGKVDTIVVEELSRLGRNSFDTLCTLNLLKEHRVNLVVRALGISSMVDGHYNQIFDLIGTIYTWVAQQERESIMERTTQGRIAAMKRGVKFGRPLGTNETNKSFLAKPTNKKILELIRLGRPIREIARATQASTTTVQKVKAIAKELKLL